MKRAILLGIAVLLVGSMAMAADIILDASENISGDYTGDYLHIGVNANSQVNVVGDLNCTNLAISDTTVGAMGELFVPAGVTVTIDGFLMLGAGGYGKVTVEGTLNVLGHFGYDGNISLNGQPGTYAEVITRGNGVINTGQHTIWGGYTAAFPVDVALSENAVFEAGVKPLYIGGTLGSSTCTMSGNASLQNTGGLTSGYYDNILNVGWSVPDSGKLIVESGNTVKFRHITVKSGGTVEYILDAEGNACVLTTELPADVLQNDPEAGTDAYMSFEPGSIINIVTTGVAPDAFTTGGIVIDLATAPEAEMLRWDTPGTWDVTIAVDGVTQGAFSLFRLREKPGDPTTLQAYIIPEPTTMALLGLGGLLAALRRRK